MFIPQTFQVRAHVYQVWKKRFKGRRNINNQNHISRLCNHTINNENHVSQDYQLTSRIKITYLDYAIIQSTMKIASKDYPLTSRIKIRPKKNSIRHALLSARIALGSLIRLPGLLLKLNVCWLFLNSCKKLLIFDDEYLLTGLLVRELSNLPK